MAGVAGSSPAGNLCRSTPAPRTKRMRGKNDYKKKAIELAKKIAKERDGYKCQKPGCPNSRDNGDQIHGAHILPVTYGLTAANPLNIIALCARCHNFSPYSWHQSPIENAAWFNQKYPGLIDRLEAAAKPSRPIKQAEWKEIHEKLKEEYAKTQS